MVGHIYLSVMVLSKVLSVDMALWDRVMSTINMECGVSDLNRKTKLEIQKTDLAYIFQPAASLTNFGFLESSIPAWSPPKSCERASTYLAFLIIIRSGLHIINNFNQGLKNKKRALQATVLVNINKPRYN